MHVTAITRCYTTKRCVCVCLSASTIWPISDRRTPGYSRYYIWFLYSAAICTCRFREPKHDCFDCYYMPTDSVFTSRISATSLASSVATFAVWPIETYWKWNKWNSTLPNVPYHTIQFPILSRVTIINYTFRQVQCTHGSIRWVCGSFRGNSYKYHIDGLQLCLGMQILR